jgi:hypothetical protein
LEKAAENLTGLHGGQGGARSSLVLASRPEAPGLSVLPKVVSAADGAPPQPPPSLSGTSFASSMNEDSGGGSKIAVNPPDAAPVLFEDDAEFETPDLPADMESRGDVLTDPHGGKVDASSSVQARGSGTLPQTARLAANAVGLSLASTAHQTPLKGETVPVSFSRTPGAGRADTPSFLKRLSDSATRCVTMRRREMRRNGNTSGSFRDSSGAAINDLLIFSPSQELEEDGDELRRLNF